ncbi:hypothetical protein D3C73_628350 [compost metagenome]
MEPLEEQPLIGNEYAEQGEYHKKSEVDQAFAGAQEMQNYAVEGIYEKNDTEQQL